MGNFCPCIGHSEHSDNLQDAEYKDLNKPLISKSGSHEKVGPNSFKILKVNQKRLQDLFTLIHSCWAKDPSEKCFSSARLITVNHIISLNWHPDPDKLYAMKVLNKKNATKKKQKLHNQQEREILASMECPFIVTLHYAFQTVDKLYMVMDFMQGGIKHQLLSQAKCGVGELFVHLRIAGRFSEQRVVFYAAELLLALEYLHDKGILYR